jgi:hypothetical protein
METARRQGWATVAFFAVLHFFCCGVPLLLLSGVSLAFMVPWWPILGTTLMVLGVVGFIWYLKRGCPTCPRNEGWRCVIDAREAKSPPTALTREDETMAGQFDLVILGSGSTAFAAALTAQELGKTAVMTEERTVGGTCVNRGCLPSKNLIEAARLLHDARHPRYPGLHPCAMGLDFATLIAQKDAVIHNYRENKYESLLGGQFDIATGHVQFVDAHTVDVGGRKLSGEQVLIATGSRPVIPDIAGLEEVPYLTSDLLTNDEPMELKELPASLLIVGGRVHRAGIGANVSPLRDRGHHPGAKRAALGPRL